MNKVATLIVLLAWQVFQIKVQCSNEAFYVFLDIQAAQAIMVNEINDKTRKMKRATIGEKSYRIMSL